MVTELISALAELEIKGGFSDSTALYLIQGSSVFEECIPSWAQVRRFERESTSPCRSGSRLGKVPFLKIY